MTETATASGAIGAGRGGRMSPQRKRDAVRRLQRGLGQPTRKPLKYVRLGIDRFRQERRKGSLPAGRSAPLPT